MDEDAARYLKQISANTARIAEALETLVELQMPDEDEEEEEGEIE